MELFKPITAKCPACGYFGAVQVSFMPNEKNLWGLACANCKNSWKEYRKSITEKKEAPTIQVTYNGFTGELLKLERHRAISHGGEYFLNECNLSIYDSEKQVTHSFTGVKLEDVKFLGGAVTFGG